MNNIQFYTTFDLPVPYKTLTFYPVSVKDYLLFGIFSQCLLLDKNSIPDPKIITMTELEYIYKSAEDKNSEYNTSILWFDRLLSLCLKNEESFKDIEKSVERYGYDENKKPYFLIGKEKFYSKDFLEIKQIIADQNGLELPDENISKEVRDALEKAREYKSRLSKTENPTFEDYIVALSVSTGWTLEYIYNMPARKFFSSINRIDNLIHYKIYLAASMSGFVEFKDKSFIKHWLSNLDKKNKYEDVSMDLEKVQEKISLESAKK